MQTHSEINEAVARKLHGDEWRMWSAEDYCHSIEAAWELCEWWNKQNPFNITRLEFWDGKWNCQFGPVEDMKWIAQADNAPRAICLAFLKLNG